MTNPQEAYKQAVHFYQSGNAGECEKILRQILSDHPDYAPAYHVMGLIGLDVGRYDIAEELVTTAISLQKDNTSFYLTLGRILSRQDKKEAAIEVYKAALALNPDFTDALNNLGTTYLSLGRLEEASEIFTRLLKANPQNFNALCNTASILYQQEKYEESISYYRAALTIDATRPNVYHDIGMGLLALQKNEEALSAFLKAVELQPHYTEALLSLGHIYREKSDFEQALNYYEKVKSIELNETAYASAIRACVEKNDLGRALAEAEYAEKLFPQSVQIINYLGYVSDKLLRYQEALGYYERAIALSPDKADLYANLASTLKNIGRIDEAIALQKKALDFMPDAPWIYSNILLSMIYAASVTPEKLAETAREFGSNIADPLIRQRPFTNNKDPERRLRIGYVSPDFRDHAVHYFLSPIYLHDTKNFELFGYSKVETPDHVTEKIKAHFDHWRDLRYVKDEDAADIIEQDKIDILIDPAGHTANNGLMIFAHKPAPIQITWLGYTATTGMKAMDYRITDPYSEPPGMTEYLNTETLWRMPDIFCAYSARENSPPVIDHPPFEDNGHITFGCFNNFTKVTDSVLETWARIMAEVPDSKLLLEISGINNPQYKAEVEERFARCGITKDRYMLEPYARANQYVLYNRIDIALDPFPCVGGTTSMDTLWMGVPFVTLAGKHFASRMGVSILTNAGLSELIAQTTDEYVSIAVELAKDRKKLRETRQDLRERVMASPLMNQEKFTRDMEDAFRQMWRKWVKEN